MSETRNVAPDAGDETGLAGGLSPGRVFIGRARELAELGRALEDVSAGNGRMFLIAGEAGIGKTRLVDELGARARSRGALVVFGACQEVGEPAYWPWRQVIRSVLGAADPAVEASDAADLGRLFPDLVLPSAQARPLSPIDHPPSVDSGQERFRFFDSLTTCFKRIAQSQPVVLVLEDLHWADDASLRLLQFLSRELRDTRILVIGTYRHNELARAHPLVRALGELTIAERIALTGLSQAEVGRFVHSAMKIASPDAMIAALYRHTQGNPFIVGEMVRLLASNDRLLGPTDIESGALGIPQGVREVIGRRLDRLSEDCNRVLTVAAVIGREFDVELLARAGGLARARITEVTAEAVAARVLVEDSRVFERYRFAHDLIRAWVYAELATGERRDLHRRVGNALEALHAAPESAAQLAELAHHFFEGHQGTEDAKVIHYATRAGEHALSVFAYEEAIKHFERARIHLEATAEGTQLCSLLLALGQAHMGVGEWQQGKSTLLRAAQIARQVNDGTGLAAAALRLVNPFPTIGRVDQARVALLEEALHALTRGDHKLRSRVMARLAIEPQYASSDERRAALSLEALEMARRAGDGVALAHALFGRFWVLMASFSDAGELLRLATEVIDLGTSLRDKELSVLGYNCRITVLLTLGDIARADADIAAHGQLASELRQPFHTFSTLALRATRAMMSGHFSIAEELAPQIAAKLGHEANARRLLDLLSFRLCYEQGWGEEVEEQLRGIAARRATELGFHAAAAALYAELGREAEARGELEQAAGNDFRDLPCDVMRLTTLAYLARACAFVRDRRRAELLYSLLAPHAGVHVAALSFSYLGSVAHYLGLLAAMLERDAVAEQHLQSALEMERRIGAGPAVARTQLAYAEFLLRRNRPRDRERGAKLIEEALRAAQGMGMKGIAHRATALHTSADPAVGNAPPAGGGAVFCREGDYWTIAYQGRSVRLKDSKGLRDIAALLAQPRRSLHVADLAGADLAAAAGGAAALDNQARQQYRARLAELHDELAGAERIGDLGRGETLRQEIEAISAELVDAYGLGGRPRRSGDPAERARAAVTMRIRAALAKIEAQHPALGRHLSRSIQTGTLCSYEPETSTRWTL